MTYVTKMCPHCHKSYSVNQPKKSGYYGSPIRTCLFCKQDFIDKDYKEIAIEGNREVDQRHLSIGTLLQFVICFPMGLISIILGIINIHTEDNAVFVLLVGSIMTLLPLCILINEIRKYPDRQEYLKSEFQRSNHRLQIPEYIMELKQLGYAIPDRFYEYATFYLRAKALQKSHDYAEAISEYKKALHVGIESTLLLLDLSSCYILNHDNQNAILTLMECANHDMDKHDIARFYSLFGDIFYIKKEIRAAYAAASYSQLFSKNNDATNVLSLILKSNEISLDQSEIISTLKDNGVPIIDLPNKTIFKPVNDERNKTNDVVLLDSTVPREQKNADRSTNNTKLGDERCYCRKCGARISLESKYCDKCGKKVKVIK